MIEGVSMRRLADSDMSYLVYSKLGCRFPGCEVGEYEGGKT